MKKTINLFLALGLFFLMGACGKEDVSRCQENPEEEQFEDFSEVENAKRGGSEKGNKGKGKPGNDDTDPGDDDTGEVLNGETYVLSAVEDADPLYKFTFNEAGTRVLLQTNPTITSWGTDYWGYWEEAFDVVDGVVDYTFGLGRTIYEFTTLENGDIEVSKTLIVSPYLGGSTTTTESVPGVYTAN